MKHFISLIAAFLLIAGCKKDNPEPPEKPNENEVKGFITVAGRDVRFLAATGNDHTSFVRTTDASANKTIINISGTDDVGGIYLRLVNLSAPGTYSFENADTVNTDVTRAAYREGPAANPTLHYSTTTTNTQILSFGTVEIFQISDKSIQAKLNVMVGDTGTLSKVYLEEILIKGTFEN